MGTFEGHAVPGSFFIIISFWWTTAIFYSYARSLGSSSRFRTSLAFQYGICRKIPVESLLKLFFSVLGVIGEATTGFNTDGSFEIGNAQHITMFSFFGLQSFLEILIFYQFPLPPYLDYVGGCMALLMEGLLFAYHLHGRTPLDVLVHTLLVYAIFAGVVALVIEAAFPENPLFPLLRSYCILLQGTWFFQVGFILYPPFEGMQHWDEHNHKQMMIITMMFTWHCAADLLVMLAVGFLIVTKVRRKSGSDRSLSMHSLLPKKQLNNNTMLTQTDSDSEGV